MFKSIIQKHYNEAVRLNFKASADLKEALRSSERIPTFISNLSDEFTKIERQRNKPISEKHIQEIVYMMTDMFIAGLENTARERYESDVQKNLRQEQASRRKEIENAANGNLSEEFQEMGLTTTEERDSV